MMNNENSCIENVGEIDYGILVSLNYLVDSDVRDLDEEIRELSNILQIGNIIVERHFYRLMKSGYIISNIEGGNKCGNNRYILTKTGQDEMSNFEKCNKEWHTINNFVKMIIMKNENESIENVGEKVEENVGENVEENVGEKIEEKIEENVGEIGYGILVSLNYLVDSDVRDLDEEIRELSSVLQIRNITIERHFYQLMKNGYVISNTEGGGGNNRYILAKTGQDEMSKFEKYNKEWFAINDFVKTSIKNKKGRKLKTYKIANNVLTFAIVVCILSIIYVAIYY